MNLSIMEVILPEDIILMRALLDGGISINDVADKFELLPSDAIQAVYPSDFHVPTKIFSKRKNNNTIIIGEDCLEKMCSRCHEFYPMTLDFWYKSTSSADGSMGWCKACEADRRRDKLINKPTK